MKDPLVPGVASAPLIGLTMYRESLTWEESRQRLDVLHTDYAEAVRMAGGVPILLPIGPEGSYAEMRWLDGLVLTGGADIEPSRYGAMPVAGAGEFRPDRDAAESEMLALAIDAGIPVLGICRGMQLLNVHFGGTLIQDLGSLPVPRHHNVHGTGYLAHEAQLREDSWLARELGTRVAIECNHHQAVDTLGVGLRATGRTDDGTIEAFEMGGDRLVCGVQWHAERSRPNAIDAFVARLARVGRGGNQKVSWRNRRDDSRISQDQSISHS